MITNIISWVCIAVILFTTTSLLIDSKDKQRSLFIFAIQYLAAFWLTLLHWPLGMASVKLVAGWMALTILGATFRNLPPQVTSAKNMRSQPFVVFIIFLLVITAAPTIENSIPGLGLPVIIGSLLLIGIGFLQLSFTSEIDRILFALLSLLSGFETLYAAIEGSVLVAGLLSLITLGIALTGAYLLTILNPQEEETA